MAEIDPERLGLRRADYPSRAAYVRELLSVFAILLGPGPWEEEQGPADDDRPAADPAEQVIGRGR